jgi:hypothetical protein
VLPLVWTEKAGRASGRVGFAAGRVKGLTKPLPHPDQAGGSAFSAELALI